MKACVCTNMHNAMVINVFQRIVFYMSKALYVFYMFSLIDIRFVAFLLNIANIGQVTGQIQDKYWTVSIQLD